MVSAVDIITYVGIPLAVFGVLPTIYTCLKSFFTLREITKTLQRNGVVAITRSALLSGIVEIEIPRRSIIPLDRADPKYFSLNEIPSHLKGGTWTLFNWKEMVIGVKSYRLQYHDELSQPQAEIEFEALIAFLLDRGAVPSKDGWADLRGAGLWTPAGTKLLLSPISSEDVLSVSMSDDSDGILSLSLNWRREWDRRGMDSLPPYWARLNAPAETQDVLSRLEELEPSTKEGKGQEGEKTDSSLDDKSVVSDDAVTKSPIRVKIGAAGVQDAYREINPSKKLHLLHLKMRAASIENTAGFWFCCGSTAFQAPSGGLWSFSIPEDVTAIARHETVPCGVMVLLGAMTDEEVPAWRSPSDDRLDKHDAHVKIMDRAREMAEEMRLPPGQREAARQRRIERDARDFHNDHMRRRMKEEQREQTIISEAMQSRRLPIAVVAEANRKWICKKLKLPQDLPIAVFVEQILFSMAQNVRFAGRLSALLDLWKNWSQSGGMTKSHYLAVREDQITFSLASFLLLIMRSTISEPTGSVVGDLQECLRLWKKIRLG